MFPRVQSDLGQYCLQYWLPKNISRGEEMTKVMPVRSKAVVLLLLTFCLLLLPLWESVIVLCFVVRYFISILVLQSS